MYFSVQLLHFCKEYNYATIIELILGFTNTFIWKKKSFPLNIFLVHLNYNNIFLIALNNTT